MAELHDRINALVDDRLMAAYWDGVEHFESKDLVLFIDQSGGSPTLDVFSRAAILAAPTAPDFMKSKVERPASEAALRMGSGDAFFWLFAVFSDEEAGCIAVNAKPLAPGGNA